MAKMRDELMTRPVHPWAAFQEAVAENFDNLDPEVRSRILRDEVISDREMRDAGQERVDPNGYDLSIIGKDVVAKTAKGEVVGRAIHFGKVRDVDGVYKRTVLVHVPSSGSIYAALPSDVRPAAAEDRERMQAEITMAQKLRHVAERVVGETKERRAKVVRGSHLVDEMLATAVARGLPTDDKSGFVMIGGPKGPRVYLAKKGGRADLSCFCIAHPGVREISEEEAREKHLGKVRGQIDFDRPDADVMEAWSAVLDALGAK